MARKPKTCPRCGEQRPSLASLGRHVHAGCCRVPKPHISCSECSPVLAALTKISAQFLRKGGLR